MSKIVNVSNVKAELESFYENEVKGKDPEIDALYGDIVKSIMGEDDKEVLHSIFDVMLLQCVMYATMINNVSLFGSKELIDRCMNSIKAIHEDLDNE